MISHLRGTLVEKGADHVVVEVGGVGYRVTVSLQTLAALAPTMSTTAESVRLLTHLQVREDALTLFGFATDEERIAFELCVSVQQVGPKLAMSILSILAPQELAEAVAREDHARLVRIPGVGKKTAERLVLELRDKLEKAGIGRRAGARPSTDGAPTSQAAAVASALVNLGYRPAEAERAAAEAAEANPGAQMTELVKKALRRLAE